MLLVQLQTQPICPKCKKNHPMKVVAFDALNQEVYYQTDCRIRPLVYSVASVVTQTPEDELFYFNNEGWITYTSTHGNYAHRLTRDVAENQQALSVAYSTKHEIIHTPKSVEEELELMDWED